MTWLCLATTSLLSNFAYAQGSLITDNTQAFAAFDETTKSLKMDNWRAAHEQLPPFSTFKVMTSLMAIDSQTVKSADEKLTYEASRYPKQDWWPKTWYEKPLTLREAFQASAVPIFRQLAFRMGEEKIQGYLNRVNYGNRDMSSGVDSFWLDGSLKVSAVDQIGILRRIFSQDKSFTPETIKKLKDVMWAEDWGDYSLYAKTGGGNLNHHTALGWYIGVLENKKTGKNIYFAAFSTGQTFNTVKEARITYAKEQLKKYFAEVPVPIKAKKTDKK